MQEGQQNCSGKQEPQKATKTKLLENFLKGCKDLWQQINETLKTGNWSMTKLKNTPHGTAWLPKRKKPSLLQQEWTHHSSLTQLSNLMKMKHLTKYKNLTKMPFFLGLNSNMVPVTTSKIKSSIPLREWHLVVK